MRNNIVLDINHDDDNNNNNNNSLTGLNDPEALEDELTNQTKKVTKTTTSGCYVAHDKSSSKTWNNVHRVRNHWAKWTFQTQIIPTKPSWTTRWRHQPHGWITSVWFRLLHGHTLQNIQLSQDGCNRGYTTLSMATNWDPPTPFLW